jgi:O-antigen/teichoic acid export membrane protein
LFNQASFAYQAMIAFSGYFFSFVIQLVLTPIIARLYTPDAYGTFATINALIMNLSLVLTIGYIDAFQIPKSQKDFFALVKLSVVLVTFFSVLIAVLVLLFFDTISQKVNLQGQNYWLHSIGPAILLLGLFQIIGSWNIRDKRNSKNTRSSIVGTLLSRGTTIGYGYFYGSNFSGLILGDMILKVSNLFLAFNRQVAEKVKEVVRVPFSEVIQIFKKYKDYPLYVFPGNYVGLLSNQLPIFWFASISSTVTGYFSFASSMLEIPLRLLGYSLGNVFAQKSAEAYHQSLSYFKEISLRLLTKLLIFGIPSFTLLAIFGDLVFDMVFGHTWRIAGLFAGIMALYYILLLCTSTLNSIFYVLNKGSLYLAIQIGLLVLRVLVFLVGYWLAWETGFLFMVYCLVNTGIYLVILAIIFILLKENAALKIMQIIFFSGVMLCFWGAIRYLLFHDFFFTVWKEILKTV